VRICTGAPEPEGADRIVIQEDADRDGDFITLHADLDPQSYIRPAGLDFAEGDLMQAPRRLSPGDVALLAAMNAPEAVVRRRPVVALIPTGDELVQPGETPGPNQIVSSNNYGLAAMLAAQGAQAELHPIARDTAESLRAALDRARHADLIVTLGGASVGDHDLVQTVFAEEGLALAFYKIAMRPGKPLMAGKIAGRMMVGLPGNPVSAMVCGHIFLRPVIDALLGLPAGPLAREVATLSEPVPANGPREHYCRAVATLENGERRCRVFDQQDSSILSLLSAANCLAVFPPNAPARGTGDKVEIIPL
jgi:molybdopterin molybdotransferase